MVPKLVDISSAVINYIEFAGAEAVKIKITDGAIARFGGRAPAALVAQDATRALQTPGRATRGRARL